MGIGKLRRMQSYRVLIWIFGKQWNDYEVPKTIEKDAVVVNKSLAKWKKCEKDI